MIFWLSESGELGEVARNLFSLMQQLDGKGFNQLYIERPESRGIGIALNDRLKRAVRED